MDQVMSPPAPPQSAPADWKCPRRTKPIPKHEWQVEQAPERPPVARWRSLRLGIWLALLLGLFATFLTVALDAPERTPLLIVTDPRAGAIPQSPWRAEEVERLKLLDRTTLTVVENPLAANVGASAAGFHQSLQQMAKAADRTGAVIVYFRLPGLVDDAGRPCLIPASASLVRTDEWLPVEAILEQVAGDIFPAHVQRLVIIDRCQPANVWQAGILADGFGDQLALLMKRQHRAGRWQRLHVLTDAAGRQKGWDSPALGGSVFGEAVWTALAGRANSTEAGGNGDRHVSLSEMARFVTHRTTEWVWENRRQVQTPSLYSIDSKDFQLFWAAPTATQQKWQAAADRLRTPVARESSVHRMKQLWNLRNSLDEQAPWRSNPLAWQRLNQRLVQYERLTSGGGSASRQLEEVERAIQPLLESLGDPSHAHGPLGQGEARLHHRQLARQMHVDQPADNDHVANVFDQIRRRPSRQVAGALLKELQKNGSIPQNWDLVVLQHLVDEAPDATWSHSDLMARTLGLMESLGDLQATPNPAASLMLESQYKPVEASLRVILDGLFIGTEERLADVEKRVTTAERQLADARKSSDDLLRAIEWRDQGAAELPRLAEWIYSPSEAKPGPTAKQAVENWIAATSSWKQLEATLEQCHERGTTVESASQAASLATQLERELSGLWLRVEQTFDRLLTGVADAQAIAEMEHLLSTTLLPRQPDSLSRSPIEQRMTLHETWQQASTQLAIQFAAERTNRLPSEAVASPGADDWMIQVARGAAPHPMLSMLSLSDEKPRAAVASSVSLHDELMSLAGGRSVMIRHALAEIPRELQRGLHASFDSTTARDRVWRAQSHRVRAAAGWLPGEIPYNPCRRMQMVDWARLLRSRSAGMTEDFWAGQSEDTSPFFVRAAKDLMDAADLCEADWQFSLTAAGKSEASQTRRQLAAWQNQTWPAIDVTAIAVPQILAKDDLQTEVDVRRTPQGIVPSGTAAIFLSHGVSSEEAGVARQPAPIPASSPATRDDATTRVNLRSTVAKSRLDKNQPLRAWAWFRGHRFADEYQLAPIAGLAVRTSPGADTAASITVQSNRRRPTAILFVLDASASMTSEVPREGTRGTIRKIDAAVDALNSLLNDLADENNVQVGVMVYGHRVAAGQTAAAGVLRQPMYDRKFPFAATLQPFEDVEPVLPVGRFGPAQLERVQDRLGMLKPWGETPLYLSIVEGLHQLENAPNDATRTMVVITDGLNYQFNPTPEKRTELDDVLRSVQGRDVAVHLLGFNIAEKDVEQARDEFAQISAATGGSSDVTVRDAARLQARLRALYQPGRYFVDGADGFRRGAQVGDPIELPHGEGATKNFDVRYESAAGRVSIEGGEKLAFRPADDGTLRVVAPLPYLTASLRDRDSGRDAPYELVTARPAWTGDDLVLRWSLRRRDGQFTSRPSVGYFRVQPVDARGNEIGPAAICLGSASVPGQSLPTWDFRIPAWPREAVNARLQGWASSLPDRVDRAESCASLLQQQHDQEFWQALPVPAVAWQIRQDGRSVTLVERYDTMSAEPQIWTELTRKASPEDTDNSRPIPALVGIERRYDAEHRLFVQTWNFDRDLSSDDLTALQFRFTSLEGMRSQSSIMPDSLLLSTIAPALVIQPVPTTTR